MQITRSGLCFGTAFLQHVDSASGKLNPFLLTVTMLENLARHRDEYIHVVGVSTEEDDSEMKKRKTLVLRQSLYSTQE